MNVHSSDDYAPFRCGNPDPDDGETRRKGKQSMTMIAVVSGSGSGIGRGIALKLADRGFDLVLLDRDEAALAPMAAEIVARGRRALAVRADVTDGARLAQVRTQVLAEFGAPTVIVNCAGWS